MDDNRTHVLWANDQLGIMTWISSPKNESLAKMTSTTWTLVASENLIGTGELSSHSREFTVIHILVANTATTHQLGRDPGT